MFPRFRRLATQPSLPRAAFLTLALVFAFASASACTGCGRFTRVKQCRTLIAQVNPALDEVLALTDAGLAGGTAGSGGAAGAGGSAVTASARYQSAAARYERLSKDLGPMEFSSEQMAKAVAEYASVLTATAQTLRTLASALDAHNGGEAERANRELERLAIRERAAVSRMDSWCQSQ